MKIFKDKNNTKNYIYLSYLNITITSFHFFYSNNSINFQNLIDDFLIFNFTSFSNFWISLFLVLNILIFISIIDFVLISDFKKDLNILIFISLNIIVYTSSVALVITIYGIHSYSRLQLIISIFLVSIVNTLLISLIRYSLFIKVAFLTFFLIYFSFFRSAYLNDEVLLNLEVTNSETNNLEINYEVCNLNSIDDSNIDYDLNKTLDHFFIVGHGYGDPNNSNTGLDENLLNYFSRTNIENKTLILTGDSVRAETGNLLQVKNEIEKYFESFYIVPGNHELDYGDQFFDLFQSDFFYLETGNFLIIGANYNNSNWLPNITQRLKINKLIEESDKKNIVLLSHQIFWFDKFNDVELANSYALFEQRNVDSVNWIEKSNKKLIIISGDYGARNQDIFCMMDKDNDITFIANGLWGNLLIDSFIELIIVDENNYFLKKTNLSN